MTSFFEDHLSLDAVVAFADGEMGLTAYQRAAAHVARCQSCAVEVAEQTSARQQLRAASCPSIPGTLLDALRSIPIALPAGPPPLGVSRDVATGRASRNIQATNGVPLARGAGAEHGNGDARGTGIGRGHSNRGRGFRIGAGAIVAGLAVGVFAATAVAERSPDPAPSPDTAQVSYPGAAPTVDIVVVAARSPR